MVDGEPPVVAAPVRADYATIDERIWDKLMDNGVEKAYLDALVSVKMIKVNLVGRIKDVEKVVDKNL